MKRLITQRPLIAIGAIIIICLALVGLQAHLQPALAQGGTAGNVTAQAYTSGVTAGRFVKLTSAGVITTATANSDKIVGICRKTADANQLTSYAPVGAETTVTSGEAIAVGDLLTVGLLGKAYVLDESQAQTQRIAAVALTAAAAADTTVNVIVVAGESVGFDKAPTAVATSTLSPSVNASGTTYMVSVDCVITLPATAIGVTYTFVCNAPDGTAEITLSPNSNDMIRGMGNAGVNNKDLINTKATAKRGDFITIIGDGAAAVGWNIVRQSGTWTPET